MAKETSAKPKISLADRIRGLMGSKPKPGARPSPAAPSTMTSHPSGAGLDARQGGPTSTLGGAAAKKPATAARRG